MYENPINLIVRDIEEQIIQQTEQTILETIRKCGVDVDKDELIKALNYDRDQYSKGYKDGVNDTLNKVRAELHATAELHEDGDYYLRDEWIDEIFDKYMTESE